jgi:hypothetical protein
VPRAINKCPRCGEPVSPFAAGCAICGTDLEAARARRATRHRIWLPRPRPLGGSARLDWLHIAVAVVVALAVPPIGFLLAVYWAFVRNRGGEPLMALVMIAVAALAAAAFLAPVWFWSHVLNI